MPDPKGRPFFRSSISRKVIARVDPVLPTAGVEIGSLRLEGLHHPTDGSGVSGAGDCAGMGTIDRETEGRLTRR